MIRCLVATSLGLTVACATASGGADTRALPAGLAAASAQLTGCTPEVDGDIARARCGDDVVLALRSRLAGAAEPSYRDEAYALAQLTGARLTWDRAVVATAGPSGDVDRARVLVPMASAPAATLIGAVRDIGEHRVQELWCSSRSAAGDQRCRELLGAVLGAEASRITRAAEQANRATQPSARSSPAHVFGRALSLPTACAAVLHESGGDASCEDGAVLSWRKLASMEEAAEALTATLAALELVDGEPYACTLAGEVAQCEDHGSAVAGLAWLDGAPVAASCIGIRNARTHGLCASLLRAR